MPWASSRRTTRTGTTPMAAPSRMVTHAKLQGLTEIVTDSMVRDRAGISAVDLPVFARGVTTRLPMSMEPIALDVPLVCAGAQVRPGDLVMADDDGVFVLPGSRVDDVLRELEEVEPIEKELQKAILARASIDSIEQLIKRKKARRG